jgi:hypothetical protein
MDSFKKALKKIPLRVRLKTAIQMHCLVEMGGHIFMTADDSTEQYRKEVEKNTEIMKFAQPLIDIVLQDVEEWKKDGCP